eukprot:CAMPEP_0116844408 /NCGR_PEP_ID=MMETSP0418-20121206/12669_1 /TAXON_ID=1158023 /ORGANISM="Astrosyne radiata, Strain 13vi08-1A" /LENGTH=510 /DNA_ID=CAMNT_0004475353 /DNA_START=206 /DNA_END=1738 /DNA_ORIENTATION=+
MDHMRVIPPDTTSPHMSPAGYQRRKKKMLARAAEQEDREMTDLYKHAKEFRWDKVDADIRKHPEQAHYIHHDGTTALHLAVMSRTGYVLDRRNQQIQKAPYEVIEALLQTHPKACTVLCQMHTYSPLAYACLVVSTECDLEDMQTVVGLILKYCPESTKIFTAAGLSPVDVHILSYSQKMIGKVEDSESIGRSSTTVLRTLLEHDPSLAEVRISKDRVTGPVEILYRSNKNTFVEAVAADDVKQATREKSIASSNAVIAQVTSWWVWRWVILIFKYTTLKKRKKGARFLALHAASGVVGCPLPVLTLAMSAFPKQISMPDEMNPDVGNLPLHEVCSWPCEIDTSSTDPVVPSRKAIAIASLLQGYPEAAVTPNRKEQTALELAVASGTTWDNGVRKLLRAYPSAVSMPSPISRLYPFMIAASVGFKRSRQKEPMPSSKRSLMTHLKNQAKKELYSIRTIYGLLRANPFVLVNCFEEHTPAPSQRGFQSLPDSFWASTTTNRTDKWVEFDH